MDKYTSLFEINTYIYNGKERGIMLSNDDIISLSIIHDYDHAFFPIIRLRLYIDLPKFAYINEDPNNILVSMVLSGDVYGINEESSEKSYTKRTSKKFYITVFLILDLQNHIFKKNFSIFGE